MLNYEIFSFYDMLSIFVIYICTYECTRRHMDGATACVGGGICPPPKSFEIIYTHIHVHLLWLQMEHVHAWLGLFGVSASFLYFFLGSGSVELPCNFKKKRKKTCTIQSERIGSSFCKYIYVYASIQNLLFNTCYFRMWIVCTIRMFAILCRRVVVLDPRGVCRSKV